MSQRSLYILLAVGFSITANTLVTFLSSFRAVTIQFKISGFIALNIGIITTVYSAYFYNLLKLHGLESFNNQTRNIVRKAYWRGYTPAGSAYHKATAEYARKQSRIFAHYKKPLLYGTLGTLLLFTGMNILSSGDETGVSKLWSPTSIVPLAYPAIGYLKIKRTIKNNVIQFRNSAVAIEPPVDDDRWWTGRW